MAEFGNQGIPTDEHQQQHQQQQQLQQQLQQQQQQLGPNPLLPPPPPPVALFDASGNVVAPPEADGHFLALVDAFNQLRNEMMARTQQTPQHLPVPLRQFEGTSVLTTHADPDLSEVTKLDFSSSEKVNLCLFEFSNACVEATLP